MSSRIQQSHIWHPYTRQSSIDAAGLPVMVRGEGPYLFDADGNRYIDAISSWWCSSLGHNHPEVMQAIRDQTAQLDHCILGNQAHPGAIELSKQLSDFLPEKSYHIHYASDGSCAIEAALKIALQVHHIEGRNSKTRFASLREAYHGDTLSAVALGFLDHFHLPFAPALNRASQLDVPPFDLSLEQAKSEADSFFAEHGTSLAALVVEPVCQGTAGIRFYPPEYLRHLQQRCREHQVLLIADEIATGFYRTGPRFAFEHADIQPDMVCMGKALSAGTLPISAAAVSSRCYELFTDEQEDHTFYHGHTFAGNPLGCAAALAALSVYRSDDFHQLLQQGRECLAQRAQAWQQRYPDHQPRQLGHILAVQQPGSESDASTDAKRIQAELLEQGILIRPLGPTTYIMPPLNTRLDVLETVLDAWESAFSPRH